MAGLRRTLFAALLRYVAGLRFPVLAALVASLFLIDVVVPDLIPFADEVLLGLGTALLAGLRKRKSGAPGDAADSGKLPG